MLTIILRTIKDRRISIIVYCLTAILILWMYLAIFPNILAQGQEFNKLLESYPKAILKAMSIEELNFSTLENFLSIEL